MRENARLMLVLGLAATSLALLSMPEAVGQAQNVVTESVIPIKMYATDGPSRDIPRTSAGRPVVSQPPPPTPAPPTPAPPAPAPPVVHQLPPMVRPITPFTPAIVVPTDTTQQGGAAGGLPYGKIGGLIPPDAPPVSDGIQVLADKQFPNDDEKNQPEDGILVRAKENTVLERPSPYAVKLTSGTILISVRRPSRLGFVETALGKVALSADGDLLVSEEHGVLHVINASARGMNCKIKLLGSEFSGKKHTFAIKPGYDFAASTHKLSRGDIRPADGIARRRIQVFEDGRIALSEFSVHGMLVHHDLIATLNQKDNGTKERRILGDLSKMAAVLNQVTGGAGYTYTSPSKLASNSKPAQ